MVGIGSAPPCALRLPPRTLHQQDSCAAAPRRGVLSFRARGGKVGEGGFWPGRSAAEGAESAWGVESCCIILQVPGIDPVVRAIWEQFVIPLSGVRFGRKGGESPPDGLASRQLNYNTKKTDLKRLPLLVGPL